MFIVLSFIVLFPACFNPSINGPDVISMYGAEKRFNRVLASKLATFSDSTFALTFTNPKRGEDIYSCLRHSYYLTSAVDYCEKALTLNNARTSEEIMKHHVFILIFVCDLKRISFFGHEKPLQGEINWCSVTGQETQDL